VGAYPPGTDRETAETERGGAVIVVQDWRRLDRVANALMAIGRPVTAVEIRAYYVTGVKTVMVRNDLEDMVSLGWATFEDRRESLNPRGGPPVCVRRYYQITEAGRLRP
jgi:hypothetical protein